MSQEPLEGVLAVWKPAGFTSHDVVAKVRRMTGTRRIGHTGTLDPQVTGVLPLCIGRATRVVEYIQDLPKEYEAVLTVGLFYGYGGCHRHRYRAGEGRPADSSASDRGDRRLHR
ncbi:hypothetical protein [Gorillibacterium massiliense]|uniref:hypothetical protein n=1 Tax=Gorillibacterium massiliense TaxID=1280390 RepID=UPI0004BC0AE6